MKQLRKLKPANMKFLLLAFVVVLMHQCAQARTFTRCELVQELKRQGFTDLENWVCLIEAESSRQTHVVGGPNSNGSYDYGLFQINDRYWCTASGAAGLDCNVKCSDLLLDDITAASRCAKIIWNRHKWSAWNGWKAKCQGALPDLTPCGV